MPVTLQVVDHAATGWAQEKVPDSEKLLEKSQPKQYKRIERVIQSSFTRSDFRQGHVTPHKNGFFKAAYEAYSHHHHLVLRPEDVWFAILTQLSFYINANAESLRSFFVPHAGQKELHLEVNVLDFAYIANEMTLLISKNVVDPTLREWVMPSFSTTTDSDKVVGAILFMGAMQKYFSYGVSVMCGLPSVTLLGEVEDWKDIQARIDKIELLGPEASQFAKLLRPIVDHFVLSFQRPESVEVVEFWNTIVHRNRLGSGTDYLTGWLTAFCFWDEEGNAKRASSANRMFDDILFPTVKINAIPSGAASVPISVDDRGDQYKATMIAGSVGITATSSIINDTDEQRQQPVNTPGLETNPPSQTPETGDTQQGQQEPANVVRDTIQPLSGWWVCENESAEAVEAQKIESKRATTEYGSAPGVDWDAKLRAPRRVADLVT